MSTLAFRVSVGVLALGAALIALGVAGNRLDLGSRLTPARRRAVIVAATLLSMVAALSSVLVDPGAAGGLVAAAVGRNPSTVDSNGSAGGPGDTAGPGSTNGSGSTQGSESGGGPGSTGGTAAGGGAGTGGGSGTGGASTSGPAGQPGGPPAVTGLSVGGGAVSGCSQPVSAAVTVANGPVTVSYVVLLNDVVQGPNPRTLVVSGAASLAGMTANLVASGGYEYRLLSPTSRSESYYWVPPSQCTFSAGLSTPSVVFAPPPNLACAGKTISLQSTVHVTSPVTGATLTWHFEVNNVRGADQSGTFPVGNTDVFDNLTMPAGTRGTPTIRVVVTAPQASSAETVEQLDCL